MASTYKKKIRHRWVRSRIRRLSYRRSLRLSAALVLCALSIFYVLDQRSIAQDAQRGWLNKKLVAVSVQDVERGEAVKYRLEAYPQALIPPGALEEIAKGDVAASYIGKGQVITEKVLASQDISGSVLTLLPDEVAVPVRPLHLDPLLEAGSLVDLYEAAAQRSGCEHIKKARLLGSALRVIQVQETMISVAVPAEVAAEVSQASLRPLVVALVAP